MGNAVFFGRLSGELSLKSRPVQDFFCRKWRENLKFALKGHGGITVQRLDVFGNVFLLEAFPPGPASEVLGHSFGTHSFSPAEEHAARTLGEAVEKALPFALKSLPGAISFAIRCNRVGSHPFSSKDVEIALGSAVQEKMPFLRVDLEDPEKIVFVEIRQERLLLYSELLPGPGGLPLGVEGNLAFLFRGKKEDLAAAWLFLRRGCHVFPVAWKEPRDALERRLSMLLPWNAGRPFSVMPAAELPKLVKERQILALGVSDAGPAQIARQAGRLKGKFSLPVLAPLALWNREAIARLPPLFPRRLF